MSVGYLLDENLPRWWRPAFQRLQPQLPIRRVGEPGAPPFHTPDPAVLEWCEKNDSILLTNNRASMPQHLADHMARGRHVPGIFQVDPGRGIVGLAQDLAYIDGASLPNEYQDLIQHLPSIV